MSIRKKAVDNVEWTCLVEVHKSFHLKVINKIRAIHVLILTQ